MDPDHIPLTSTVFGVKYARLLDILKSMKKKQTKSKNKKVRKVSSHSEVSIYPIRPLGDRILVKPFSEEELKEKTSSFGIIIPDTVSKEKSAQGRVLAVGEGRWQDGELVPVSVKVGDTVFFSKYAYDEITHKGEELYLLKEDNVLAVIK